MAKSKGSKGSSDREKWNKVFNAMVHMLRTQQTQLESLAKDRKLLEDRIKLQYDRWVSDVNLFQDQITQMKNDFTVQEMQRMVEAAKADLVIGLKQREAVVYKHKFENADSELSDFRGWFNYLSHKCSGQKDSSSPKDNKIQEQHRHNSLESELRRLKCENEKLSLDKNTEVSALLSEKNFAWNQYNRMEKDLKYRLKQKNDEIECANDKIQRLLAGMEELQSSNTEKDQMLLTLKNDVAKLRCDSAKKDEEVSRLSKELEVLRKCRNHSVTPVLRHCKAGSGSSRLKVKNSKMDGQTTTIKKELDSSHGIEKGCRSSKRKAVEIIDLSADTRLFTSSFRVPKLKSSSPSVNSPLPAGNC